MVELSTVIILCVISGAIGSLITIFACFKVSKMAEKQAENEWEELK